MIGSVAKRARYAAIALVAVLALILTYGGIRNDAINPALAAVQGCPAYLPGQTYAFNANCPPEVHLLPLP